LRRHRQPWQWQMLAGYTVMPAYRCNFFDSVINIHRVCGEKVLR
jgi:hypothetical protein